MKKYIDADKLIAEIEMWRDKAKDDYNESTYSMGRCDALAEFRNHIVSLQQEQPKESEDERIRKAISAAICGTTAETVLEANGVKLVDALSYLEKQKDAIGAARQQGYEEGMEDGASMVESMQKEQKPSTPEDIAAAYQMGLSEGRKEQKPAEWSEDFEDNIRNLLHDKLTRHSEDGRMSWATLIDDKTLKDIVSGIWFYVGKEALKYPNKKKYIDAEKLITIIEERRAQQDQWINSYHNPINQGISLELTKIIHIITSLQQEQPECGCSEKPNNLREQPEVDLEKEAVSFCYDNGINISPRQTKNIARHFYELGKNARKEENNGKDNTAL